MFFGMVGGPLMPRFLGVDYGSRRIGLAVSDAEARIALPLATLEGRVADDIQRILRACQDYEIDAFVVGLPLNMDDSEGPQAKRSRKFGKALAEATGRPVHYWDERLSSFAAKDLLSATRMSHGKRKARLDRVAAQIILQEFLDARPGQDHCPA